MLQRHSIISLLHLCFLSFIRSPLSLSPWSIYYRTSFHSIGALLVLHVRCVMRTTSAIHHRLVVAQSHCHFWPTECNFEHFLHLYNSRLSWNKRGQVTKHTVGRTQNRLPTVVRAKKERNDRGWWWKSQAQEQQQHGQKKVVKLFITFKWDTPFVCNKHKHTYTSHVYMCIICGESVSNVAITFHLWIKILNKEIWNVWNMVSLCVQTAIV